MFTEIKEPKKNKKKNRSSARLLRTKDTLPTRSHILAIYAFGGGYTPPEDPRAPPESCVT